MTKGPLLLSKLKLGHKLGPGMNSLYALGLRQTSSIQQDIDKIRAGDSSAALQGELVASSSPTVMLTVVVQ